MVNVRYDFYGSRCRKVKLQNPILPSHCIKRHTLTGKYRYILFSAGCYMCAKKKPAQFHTLYSIAVARFRFEDMNIDFAHHGCSHMNVDESPFFLLIYIAPACEQRNKLRIDVLSCLLPHLLLLTSKVASKLNRIVSHMRTCAQTCHYHYLIIPHVNEAF